MQTLDFHALSRSVQERFAAAARGRVDPKPLAREPLDARPVWLWSSVIAVAGAALVALFGWGFGDARSAGALQGPVSFVADIALVAAVALGVVRLSIRVAQARALPYPRGVYVFPLTVVDARSSTLRVHSLAEASGVEQHGNVTSLEVDGERRVFRHRDRASAARAVDELRAAIDRARAPREENDPRITLTYLLDPLQRPRVSSPIGLRTPLAHVLPFWTRRAWALAPIAGLVLGPALLHARNALGDRVMFARADRSDTVDGWREYVARGGARSPEVERVLLPRAELRAAEREGTVEAIERFRDAHPSSAIAGEIEGAHRAALLADLDRAKSEGTLVALQDFAKRHPDHGLQPELRAAIHSLFAPALQTFQGHAPADHDARAMVEHLFAYCENKAQAGSTDTTVQIRFRRRPGRTMRAADKMVERHHWFIGEASYPSRYFDVTHVAPYETSLAAALGKHLGVTFGASVFTFQEGPRLDDAQDALPPVTVPTLVVTHVEEWPHTFDGSITKPRGIWVDVAFSFEAVWLVPGDPEPHPFVLEVKEKLPKDVIESNPEGGTPQAPLEERIYGAMTADAFRQLEQKYLALFVPAKAAELATGGGPLAR